MAKTLYLLQYNNYFNRTVKGQNFGLLGQFTDDGAKIVGQIQNMTLWNPNDGVQTVITSNLGLTGNPDYALLCDGDVRLQAWFVLEAKRLQAQQYQLTLRRDQKSDDYNAIMQNPDTYVERGWCDTGNPAIYNKEPLTFNQIKSDQKLLYDKTCVPWIVGYLNTYGEFPENDIKFTVEGTTFKVNLKTAKFFSTIKQPYIIFYMPFWDCYMVTQDGTSKRQSGDISKATATAISQELSGAGWLLDLQILPYCPLSEISKRYKSISIHTDLSSPIMVDGSTQVVGYVCYTDDVNIDGFCYYDTGDSGEVARYQVNDIKEEANTTFLRIMSPNGNGAYEFTPAKSIYLTSTKIGFTYRGTYMPYQPYIKVEAGFDRLYGGDYDDTRGLICGGDFSMPQITDQWKTFQLNNKNYQNMFYRQIDSLDLQQTWAKRQDVANAITGGLSGIVGGAMVGGIAGGLIGGLASAAAGGLDIYANKQLRADQKEAMLQQFDWQNQNIQALPNTITKLTNFNEEMPKVPYLEIYTCTDEEKDNFKKYLALRDYTINRYGRFIDYVKPNNKRTFLRGTLIRLEGVKDDTHYLAALADEVKQGFYVGTDSET